MGLYPSKPIRRNCDDKGRKGIAKEENSIKDKNAKGMRAD